MNEKQENLKVIVNGMGRSIEHSVTNLETVTRKLDSIFKGLDARKLPEYQEAINAIRKYKDALIKKFNDSYDKEE